MRGFIDKTGQDGADFRRQCGTGFASVISGAGYARANESAGRGRLGIGRLIIVGRQQGRRIGVAITSEKIISQGDIAQSPGQCPGPVAGRDRQHVDKEPEIIAEYRSWAIPGLCALFRAGRNRPPRPLKNTQPRRPGQMPCDRELEPEIPAGLGGIIVVGDRETGPSPTRGKGVANNTGRQAARTSLRSKP